MTRVKSKAIEKHRKVKKLAKGYKHARSRRFKPAMEAVLHAGQYAYVGRKQKKRVLRSLWIKRLNAAVREEGMKNYSEFIDKLNKAKVELDRKVLSDIAVNEPETFKEIVKSL